MAYDNEALNAITSAFMGSVFSYLRSRAKKYGGNALDAEAYFPGSVSFIQRFGSAVNLNVHIHSQVSDGAFARLPDGRICFMRVPRWSPHTTPHSTSSEFITITLPVHPFKGKHLPILSRIRRRDGRRYILAEHPCGWGTLIPIEWTNLSIQIEPYFIDGQEVRLSADGLTKLAAAVYVAKGLMNYEAKAPSSTGLVDVSSIEAQTRDAHAKHCNRHVGNTDPQNVARRHKRHGENS